MAALARLNALDAEQLAEALAPGAPGRAALICAAAEAGLAEAQAAWGQMLLDGVEAAKDERAAFGWFIRAAASGHLEALNMVGRCYDLGWGVAVDKARAADCFRVAAERGLAPAMYNHATALALGEGVPEDKAAALAWLERAADAGFAKAWSHLGSFHEDGWAVPRDLARAAACYARGAAAGDFRAMFNHARMLGPGPAALGWLRAAGAAGDARFVAEAAAWLERSRFGTVGAAVLRAGAGAAC